MTGHVTGAPRWLLRIEGLAVLIAATLAYVSLGKSWQMYALFFLVPDMSMAGYLSGRKTGAVTYNIGHSYAGPFALLSVGVVGIRPCLLAAGLIWAGHIGFDRALGYGLKYADGFGFSHLGRIGSVGVEEQRVA